MQGKNQNDPAGGKGAGGRGWGRGGGRGLGPPQTCLCPSCGAKVPHQPGKPCLTMKCPNCGSQMVRGD